MTPNSPVVTLAPYAGRRVSWGAVFAGAVAAIAIQLVLALIGLAFGAANINPATQTHPFAGFATGSAVWMFISGIIALFCGGWIAAHLAAVPKRADSMLHGVLCWSMATLATAFLVSVTAGRVVGGAAGIVGQGLSAVGAGVGNLAAAAAAQTNASPREVAQVRDQAMGILQDYAKGSIGAAGQRVLAGNESIQQAISDVFDHGAKGWSQADKTALVNSLAANTSLTREQAANVVDKWIALSQQANVKLQQLGNQAAQAAQTAMANIARVAGWSAVALILFAVAAGLGGWVGKPENLVTSIGGSPGAAGASAV